ncbi:MAG: cutinase family protein [Mycobacterium sp.]
MRVGRVVIGLGAAVFSAAAMVMAPAVVCTPSTLPTAAAACAQVEVIFARGRIEPAGPGAIGRAFVNGLRDRTGRNINLYSVDYPADNEIDVGANDMSQRIQDTIASCPDTRIVLGGYSLGAAVTDVVLAVPFAAFGFAKPLPPGADLHIAAVALFGNGTAWVAPITNFSPLYSERTIELCHGSDPVCNPADPNTWENNWSDHLADAYIEAGMVNQAVDFVSGRV